NAGGFKVMVEDRGDLGLDALQDQANKLKELANSPPANSSLLGVSSIFTVKYPQMFVDINRDQVRAMGLSLGDVYDTLQIYLGSLYVNDFNLFGRTWQVVVQAEAKFRNNVAAVRRLKVRNAVGNMAPVGTIADIREINGPLV